jgi:hypothetical protein
MSGRTDESSVDGHARLRVQGIIGVSPVFLIAAKGDDRSMKADLAGRIFGSVPAVISRHRRDAYDTFGSVQGHASQRPKIPQSLSPTPRKALLILRGHGYLKAASSRSK